MAAFFYIFLRLSRAWVSGLVHSPTTGTSICPELRIAVTSSSFRLGRSLPFRALMIPAIVAALFVAGCAPTPATPPQFSVTTTSGQLVTGTINSVYAGATLTAANGTAPFMWTATGLPTGLTLSSAGMLSGTPTQSGSFNVMVTVTDAAGHTATANLTLNVDLAPTFTSGTSATFTAGTAGTFTATASGFPAPTFTTTSMLPAGVTLTAAGVLSGTPGATSGGVYAITITAANGQAPNATQNFTLTVNQTPVFTSGTSTSFVVGSLGNFQVTASGFPAPTFTTTSMLPAGVTLSSAGVLSGTPGAGTQASYPITITASNGIGTSPTQSFTLNVDLAPTFTSGTSTTFTAGSLGTFTATATGFPVPTFSTTSALPAGVTLSAAGVLSGTPGPGTGAVYPITITAANGVAPNATQNFTLTVNQTPVFTSQNSTSFLLGSSGSFQVTASGFPAPTFSTTSPLPAGVSLISPGVLSGTPGAGTQGSYPITITASNGIGTSPTQNFTLNVDLPPTFTSGASTTFTTGALGSFTATASGFPAPTFSTTSALPAGVTLTAAGVLSGTPGPGTGAVYPITITAANGVAPNASQNFTLTVNQTPVFTSGTSTTFAVGALGNFQVTASGFPAPTFSTTSMLPSGVTLSSAGVLSGTPGPGTQGPYPITITAQNGIGTNPTQAFTLTVNNAPGFTSLNSHTFTVGTPGTFTVTTVGNPTPAITVTAGAPPSGVSFTDNGNGTATLTGTPAPNTGGSYPLTLKAHNGVGTDATQNFTLTVDQAPTITSLSSTTFTESVFSSFTVMTSGFPTSVALNDGAATLPSGVNFTDNGNGTATLSGTPAAGTSTGSPYSFTITGNNGVAPNATQNFTLTVNTAPGFSSSNTTTFAVGTLGSFTVTGSGNPKPTLTKTAGTLPTGVTLNDNGNGTATLGGTPAANTGGSYSFTITAHNGVGTDATQTFTLKVNQAPSITSSNGTTFVTTTLGSFTVTTSTSEFPTPVTLNDGGATLPSGVTFTDNGDGTATLKGTPATGTQGSYPFTITASNGITPNGTQNFTLTVSTGLPTISILGPPLPPIQAGTARPFTVTVASDVASDLPTVTSFTLNGVACTSATCGSFSTVTGTAGSGSYAMTYTPPASLTATISPTVTVSPSVSGPWFAGTFQFNFFPSGIVMTFASSAPNVTAGVMPGSAARTLTFTVYNDAAGNPGVTMSPLTAYGYACQTLSPNSCGTLGTPSRSASGTTTTTTVTYTPPAAAPAPPYDRPLALATSVADPTKFIARSFQILGSSGFLMSALTGGPAVPLSFTFTDATAIKTSSWTITAGTSVSCTVTPNSAPCVTPSGTLSDPITTNGNTVTSTATYTPPASVPTGSGQATPSITMTETANSTVLGPISFNIVDGTCGTGHNAVLNGSYAFLLKGGGSGIGYNAAVGSFTADGNGNITGGLEDINRTTGVSTNLTLTGSYSVGADNRGCLTLTNSNGGTATYRIALGTISGGAATQGSIVFFNDTAGNGTRAEGFLKQQNLTNITSSSFNGTYAIGLDGVDGSGGRIAIAGYITSNGVGGITSITEDVNDTGSVTNIPTGTISGTYNLATNAPSGRGTEQVTGSGNVSNSVFYSISPSDAFVMTTDPIDSNHPIVSGESKLRTSTAFPTTPPNSTNYAFYLSGIDNSNGGSTTTLGQTQFGASSNGKATAITLDENDNGIESAEQVLSGASALTFSIAANGKMTGSGGAQIPLFYMIDTTQGFIVGTDSLASSGYIQQQTGPLNNTSVPANAFFGGGAPTAGGTYEVGAVSFNTAALTLTGTSDTSGPSGGLQPNSPISNNGAAITYTFSAVTGFNPTAPGQGIFGGGDILAYIVSPTKIVFMQVGTTAQIKGPNPAELFIGQQ